MASPLSPSRSGAVHSTAMMTVMILSAAAGVGWADITLVEKGVAKAVIAADAAAPAVTAFAARELQAYLKKISGAELPIEQLQDDGPRLAAFAAGRPVVLVGESRYTRELGMTTSGLEPDGFTLLCRDNILVVLGKDDQRCNPERWASLGSAGSLHGVYRLLERLGVRFYYPGAFGEVIPKKDTISLEAFRSTEAPWFRMRLLEPPLTTPEAELWTRKIGGGATVFPNASCHSFEGWWDRFSETHPEYFNLQGDQRINHICFWGPGVREQMVADANEWLRTHDADLYPYFTVMHNDGAPGPCQCPECQKRMRPEDGWYGIQSDSVAQAAIEVAEAIRDEFPDRGICIGAYNDYARPPVGIERLPDNVAVSIFKHRQHIWSEEAKRNYYEAIEKWAALRPREICFWEYYNFDCWGRNWRGVPGVTTQFIVEDFRRLKQISDNTGVPMTGELVFCDGRLKEHFEDRLWWLALDYYVTAKCQWDPNLDPDALLEDFYTQFFGPAAEPMGKLYARAEEVWNTGDHGGRNFSYARELTSLDVALEEGFVGKSPWETLFTQAVRDELVGLLERADKVARDSPYRERVAMVRRGVDWMLQEAAAHAAQP